MSWAALALLGSAALAAAPDGGVPARGPMPTDAQCTPLAAAAHPLSFATGEELAFDLDALGARAGRMTMRVLAPRDGLLPIEVHAQTNTFFSKVRRVDGTATSFLDAKTVKPARYLEDATENETHRVADVTFKPREHRARVVSTVDGRTGEYQLGYANDALDVAGAIFYLRQLPMKPDARVCFDVYGIRRIWRVWGRVLPKEHVSLPVGEFDAWHLVGEAAQLGLPDARRDLNVWISDDPRRLPLACVGSINLGAVRATLTGFARPGDRGARAENKGNLSW